MKLKTNIVVQSLDGTICGCPLRNCKMTTPCKLRMDYLAEHDTLNHVPAPLNYRQDTFNNIYKEYHTVV